MYLHQLFEKIPLSHPQNPALMTWEEYWEVMNPGGKHHSDEAYNWDLDQMNRIDLGGKIVDPQAGQAMDKEIIQSHNDNDLRVFKKDSHSLIGYTVDNVLYIIKGFDDRALKRDVDRLVNGDLIIKYVKYPMAYFKQKEAIAQRSKYSKLLQNIKIKGQSFQIREDNGDFAIFNNDAQKVAVAQDEWGAILVSVAQEYRSYGFGTLLGKIYRERYPEKNTGGTTYAGSAQVKRVWNKFVREALADGTYSKLVKSGKISSSRVKEIIKDLDDRPEYKDEPKTDYVNDYKNWLIMDTESGALVYHKDIYESEISFEGARDYIMGYSLIRGNDAKGNAFLYSIDYENNRAETMLLYASLQIVTRDGDGLDIEESASDFSESIQDLKYTEERDGVIYLDSSLPAIENAFKLERQYRKKRDKYDEYKYNILEAAESKYKV